MRTRVSLLLEDLGADLERLVVIDMEASPEHLSRGTVRHAVRPGLLRPGLLRPGAPRCDH